MSRESPAEAEVTFDRSMIRSDPVLGYACKPGTYQIELRAGSLARRFTVGIDEDGRRRTAAAACSGKPEIWIFGCSFTWGWPLNDEETFPWQVQRALPQFCVRNYAGNGYGTLHALLQLRDLPRRSRIVPRIVVIVHNPFHVPRNVAAPSALAMYTPYRKTLGDLSVPLARLAPDGSIESRLMAVDLRLRDPEPPAEEARTMTRAITAAIYQLCTERKITPVFALQSGPDIAGVAGYAREIGFRTVDIGVDLNAPRYTMQPLDPHPNAAAHGEYSRKLTAALQSID